MDMANAMTISTHDAFNDFDGLTTELPTIPSPAPESAQEPADPQNGESLPEYVIRGNIVARSLGHVNLVLEGICTHCAHCGHQLTDSVSINRGIGPICSKKGYEEEPTDPDEMQAMIDLAEFPDLVKFLTEHYRPLGLRGLVNGLVRVASLNRPRGRNQCEGNVKLFTACCDAIDSLGHAKLSNLLRETIVVVEVTNSETEPGCVIVKVKYRDYIKAWGYELAQIHGSRFVKELKGRVIPVHKPGDEKSLAWTRVASGKKVTNRQLIWDSLVHHYCGLVARTPKGVFKIRVLE